MLLLDDIPVHSRAVFEDKKTARSHQEYFVLGAATIGWPPAREGGEVPVYNDRLTRLRLLRAYPGHESLARQLLFEELGYRSGIDEPEFITWPTLARVGARLPCPRICQHREGLPRSALAPEPAPVARGGC